MKVSPAFSKAAGCRGGALARAPQSAELSCAYLSAGGGLRGNPRRGFPLFLYSCACAPFLWEVFVALSCHSTPFLWCLPKETVSSRQRKAPFLPWWLHHSRERYCLGCLYSSSPDLGRAWWLSGAGGRKKAGGKDRRLPRRCRGDPIITCTSPAGGSPLLCFHASNFQHPARGGSREACNPRRNMASLISDVGLRGPKKPANRAGSNSRRKARRK